MEEEGGAGDRGLSGALAWPLATRLAAASSPLAPTLSRLKIDPAVGPGSAPTT